jgi:hypothetical protein
MREGWLSWAVRAAPEIAAAGGDKAAVGAALDRAVRVQLAELACTPIPAFAVTPADATATTPVAQLGRPGPLVPATVRLQGR